MVLHIFFMLLLCSISGNIWNRKHEVKNFHCLFQLMKGFKKKIININLVDTKVIKYPYHLDGTFEDKKEEKF